jgi:hypothetical protein
LVANIPLPINWGLATEYDPNDQYTSLNTLATSIAIIGDTVYVGGKFNHVRNGANAPLTVQPYLAAFNKNTGAWISTFRPVLDGAVWALKATPDGKLLVAGNFSSYNGVAGTAAIVKVDPATGQPAAGFSLSLSRTGARVMGRALTIKDDWVYLAGRFNNATGGTPAVSNLGIGGLLKFKWSDGTPAPTWRPYSGRTVETVEASPTSDRLWVGGYIDKVSGTSAHGSASLSLVTGQRNDPPNMQNIIDTSPVQMYNPWEPTWDLREIGGNLYVGGTQHYLGRHDGSTFARTGYSYQGNGDYQVIDTMFGWVYAGCHCGMPNYTQQVDGTMVATGQLSAAGAWAENTFVRNSSFKPDIRNWAEGPWAMQPDPAAGCLWIGGDWTAGAPTAWTSGIGKFCMATPIDTTPPSTPTNLTAVAEGSGVRLNWTASTDTLGGAVTYEILRGDDTAVMPSSTTTLLDPVQTATRYFVRAVDAAGNKSATTAAVIWLGPIPTVATSTTQWSYKGNGAPASNWTTTGSLAGWTTGPAPFGVGLAGAATTVSTGQPTQYYATDVSVANRTGWGSVLLTVSADDGVLVRVNGTEVTRDNLPGGPITHTTLATSASTGATGRTRTIELPPSAFVDGVNRISVEVHQATATNDPDAWFNLTATGSFAGTDTAAPAGSTLNATTRTLNSITVTWTRPADADLGGWCLSR